MRVLLVFILICYLLAAPFSAAEGRNSKDKKQGQQAQVNDIVLTRPEPEDQWLQCDKVMDCILVRGLCGILTSVNHQFKQDYIQWAQQHEPAYCVATPEADEMCLSCRDNQCHARIQQEEVPPDDLPLDLQDKLSR